MAKDVILAADLGGDLLTADELAAIPDFAGIRRRSECHQYHNRNLEKDRNRRPAGQLAGGAL